MSHNEYPKLHIIDVSKNAHTGRITVDARIIDGAQEGAVETWHIEALEIATKYHGDADAWLAHIAREMHGRHKSRMAAHSDVQKWKGQKIDIKG